MKTGLKNQQCCAAYMSLLNVVNTYCSALLHLIQAQQYTVVQYNTGADQFLSDRRGALLCYQGADRTLFIFCHCCRL